MKKLVPPIQVTVIHEQLHRLSLCGHRDIPCDVEVTFFINFYISSIPAVIDENRKVLRLFSVNVNFLIILKNLNQVVLTILRQAVCLCRGDGVDVRGIPTQFLLFNRLCNKGTPTVCGGLPYYNALGILW